MLNVIVFVERGEERLDFGARIALEGNGVLRDPNLICGGDAPATRAERFRDDVQVRRLRDEPEQAVIGGFDFLRAGFEWTENVTEPFAGAVFERYRVARG